MMCSMWLGGSEVIIRAGLPLQQPRQLAFICLSLLSLFALLRPLLVPFYSPLQLRVNYSTRFLFTFRISYLIPHFSSESVTLSAKELHICSTEVWSVFIMTYEDECMCFLACFERRWLYIKTNLLDWPSLLWREWKNAPNKVAAHASILIKSADSVPLFINFTRSRLVHISVQPGPNQHEEIICCFWKTWTRSIWWVRIDRFGHGRCMALQWPMEMLPVFNWGTWKQWAACTFCKWGNQDMPQTLLVFIWMLQ